MTDPVEKVTLSSSNLARTLAYWHEILGLKIFSQDKDKAVLGFSESQAKLEFKDIGKSLLQIVTLSVSYESTCPFIFIRSWWLSCTAWFIRVVANKYNISNI
jgi:hypothetical protein